jgi:hypothetical protein
MAISAARFYWELHLNLYNAANISVPIAVSVFPARTIKPREVGPMRRPDTANSVIGSVRVPTYKQTPRYSSRKMRMACPEL